MQKLVVEAGGHANLPALIRNQSGIVDNYEIQVKGMPDEWWNVAPPSVYLVPFGAPSGTYEQEVSIHFSPPRSAEAEAKVWELEVVAVSRAQGEVAGSTKSLGRDHAVRAARERAAPRDRHRHGAAASTR